MSKPEWVLALEAKHGLPIEDIPGMVYVLHYDEPQVVWSVSRDYAGTRAELGPHGLVSERPITHYVGWTQQADPRRRIYRHGPAALVTVASLTPGTMRDETQAKIGGVCAKCGEPLCASLASDQPAYQFHMFNEREDSS